MVIHPLAPHDIYIRTDVGGAYRYDRAAGRWLPLMDRIGMPETAFGVESLAVDPTDPNTVYAAVLMNRVFTATGGGYYNEASSGEVLVSHSRGVWWTRTNMPVGQVYMGPNDDYRGMTGERLAVDPARPGVVYFGSRQNGLWRLNASGWSQLGGGIPTPAPVSGNAVGITFVLASQTMLYAGAYGSGVWASADGGATWTAFSSASTAGIYYGANPVRATLGPDGTLYVSFGGDEGATTGSVARYRNGTWADITPTQQFKAYSGISIDPAGSRLAVSQNGGRVVFFSSDQGATWKSVPATDLTAQPPYYPPPTAANYNTHPGTWGTAALIIDPAKPTRLFQTNGYGVIATEDFTAATPVWSWKMQNLEELVVLDVKVPPLTTLPGTNTPGADLFSGVADMIGFRHASRDAAAATTLGTVNFVALGTSVAYCAKQPQYMAWVGWGEATSTQPITGYSSDGGQTWTPFASMAPGFGGKIAISATDPNRMVWAPTSPDFSTLATPQYSTDAGKTWQKCLLNGAPLTGSWNLLSVWWNGNVLAADRVDGQRFYFYNDGKFYSSTDGGATWQAGNSTWPSAVPVPNTIIVNVVPNPAVAGDVWISLMPDQNQPGRLPLFHSTDGGQTFSAVASVDNANFVAFGKGTGAGPAIYIHGRTSGATADAIYQSLDTGVTWKRISDPTQMQFGNIAAMDGDMRQADLVYVGTGGRGIFYGYGPGANIKAPSIGQQSVVNGASVLGGAVAPGEMVTISGQDLGPDSLSLWSLDETGSLSTTVRGAQVFFDGDPAPLLYSSSGETGALVPYAVAGNSTTSVQTSYLGALSQPVDVPVVPSAPGIFTQSGQGSGAGVILNRDYSENSPLNPAARGDNITIYATGEGQTTPPGVDGVLTAGSSILPSLPVTVQIDGIGATVASALEAPRVVTGILQVNAQVPSSAHPGPAVPVVVSVGGVASQAGVTLAVK
jgi:uncharacterized protein (TIGR03437 family)